MLRNNQIRHTANFFAANVEPPEKKFEILQQTTREVGTCIFLVFLVEIYKASSYFISYQIKYSHEHIHNSKLPKLAFRSSKQPISDSGIKLNLRRMVTLCEDSPPPPPPTFSISIIEKMFVRSKKTCSDKKVATFIVIENRRKL